MAFGDQDLDSFFRDGDRVTRANGRPAFMAHFDIPEVVDNFSPLNVRAPEVAARPAISYSTGSASDLVHDELITLRGTRYKVRSPRKKNDGQVSEADLSLP